jgi:hypothetical protein
MSLTKASYSMVNGAPANILDFGGVCDGVTNDANALMAAIATGKEVVIPAESYILLSSAQVPTFIQNLNNVSPQVVTTFNLPAGDFAITTQVEITNSKACNIIVKGVATTQVSATAVSNLSGSAKNYSVQYTLTSASQVAIGDYIYVGYTAGTGSYNVAEGVWKVTGVSGSNVTVKHTLNSTWPALTVTSARVVPLRTILRWPTTQRGLAISGTSLRGLQNLVIASQFNITTGSASDTYSDGLQIGTAADYLNTGSFESQQTNAGAVWCTNVGVVEWSGNGVQTIGGNAYFFQAAFCSNGWRGIQAASNGSIGAKYTAAVGNGASGYETEGLGFIDAIGAVAAGNGQQGVYVIGPASISFNNGYAYNNVAAGLDARNFGTILADGAKVDRNAQYGCYTTAGNILFGSSATSSNNTTYDAYSTEHGVIDGKNCTSLGVTNFTQADGAVIIDSNGEIIWPTELKVESSTSQISIGTTSIADMVISTDAGGTGTFTPILRAKATSGIFYPSQDNTASLGRAGERWSVVYAATGTINTSDARAKQDVASLDDAEKRVAAALKGLIKKFRFKDAVAEKGDKARIHVGVIAQEVEAAFAAEGLDAARYGVLCHDQLEDGDRYGVRYDELLAFIIAAI